MSSADGEVQCWAKAVQLEPRYGTFSLWGLSWRSSGQVRRVRRRAHAANCPTIIGVQSRSLKTNRKQQPQASEKNGTAVCGPVLRDDFLPAGLTPTSSTCCGWHAFNCANSISTFAFCRQKAMQCYAMFEDVISAQKQENISKSSMHTCITCKLSSSDQP